jgi:predicted nucleotidyltransferase
VVDQRIIETVQEYVRRLRAGGLPVSRTILFGSRARGGGEEDSDIDLLLLSPAFEDLTWRQEGKAWKIAASVDWRLEPVLCGEALFEDNDWHPLIDVAKREGVVLPVGP